MIKDKNFRRILLALSLVFFIPQLLHLIFRIFTKKEKIERILERFAFPSDQSFEDIIWIHSASVGETIIAFLVIDLILKKNKSQQFLITSGTITSAELAETRMETYNHLGMNKVIIHQMLPMDNIFTVNRFINYWKPKFAVFIESELWPNIIFFSHLKFPLLLINARMSEKSFKRWKAFAPFINKIGQCFSSVIVQTKQDLERFTELGFLKSKLSGNIKYINSHEVINNDLFEELLSQTASRKIIFAASTHENEEEIIVGIYKNLKNNVKNLLLVIAPRHPSRKDEIIKIIHALSLNFVLRTENKKITAETDVYLLDSIGETASIFRLKPITFMGGSFTVGGHNILEPARYHCPIIFGPDMHNFEEISQEFLAQGAALRANDKFDLEMKLQEFIKVKPKDLKEITNKAAEIIKRKQDIEKLYFEELSKYM